MPWITQLVIFSQAASRMWISWCLRHFTSRPELPKVPLTLSGDSPGSRGSTLSFEHALINGPLRISRQHAAPAIGQVAAVMMSSPCHTLVSTNGVAFRSAQPSTAPSRIPLPTRHTMLCQVSRARPALRKCRLELFRQRNDIFGGNFGFHALAFKEIAAYLRYSLSNPAVSTSFLRLIISTWPDLKDTRSALRSSLNVRLT